MYTSAAFKGPPLERHLAGTLAPAAGIERAVLAEFGGRKVSRVT